MRQDITRMVVNAIAGPSRPRVDPDLPTAQPATVDRQAAHRQRRRGGASMPPSSAVSISGTEPQARPVPRGLSSRCRRCLVTLVALSFSTSLVVACAAVLPVRGLAHASGILPRALIVRKPDPDAEGFALPHRPIGVDRPKGSPPPGTSASEQYPPVPNKLAIFAPAKSMVDLRHLYKSISAASSCVTRSCDGALAPAQVLVPRAGESSTSTPTAAPAVTTNNPSASSTALLATTSAASASTSTSTPSSTTFAAVSTSTSVPSNYTLPQAFDATLGTNFTSTACPSFFRTFLANPAFIACTPFSLLMSTSNGFFMAARSPFALLPTVLDAACAAPVATCTTLMNQLAGQLAKARNCGNDLSRRNPLVLEALEGFQNYAMMYQAGCQRNNVTAQYCFAEANVATDPSAQYYYYLPEGTFLPSGTVPECGSCTQGLMNIYAQYARNSTYVISQTYGGARTQTALACGPSFAPLIAVASTSAAAPHVSSASASVSPLLLFVVLMTSLYPVIR
ncbi:BQ5605_C001g00657 [Microbotryum silenes-dioicae]|uniref:BQ5605_C001g00657 protein n=1 Tax=Microbotryum silenes-dioicae TaxID=796604 RepID=A0A2X0M820_9BASI|nr:BQ5605_C001g00657 [Microbotryum silenes-dioicae]